MHSPWTELRTPADLVDDYTKYKLEAKTNPLSFGMPKLDAELKGELRGKIAAIIGYGGTKKSLFSFNVAMNSSTQHNSRAIYSTMEMSYEAMLERVIDHKLTPPDERDDYGQHLKQSFTQWLRNEIDSPESAKHYAGIIRDHLNQIYGKYLLLNQKNGMTYKSYKALITEAKNRYDKIDMLVVDGLSMMGGNGTEREKTDENTMMLKELSKEERLFIPIIVHASRGETKHTRDLSNKARGSEKIVDNCDMCFTLSLIQDPLDPATYRNDEGYIRLWNKRGSGSIVDVVYDFNPYNLSMTESAKDPSSVELDNSSNAPRFKI